MKTHNLCFAMAWLSAFLSVIFIHDDAAWATAFCASLALSVASSLLFKRAIERGDV